MEDQQEVVFSPQKKSKEVVAGLDAAFTAEGVRYTPRLPEAEEDVDETQTIELTSSKKSDSRSSPQDQQHFTVEDAVNKLGFGPFQVLVTVFSGLIWMSDAMELMVLSILSPVVQCQWKLSKEEEALITTVVFIGMFFGGFFWGWFADVMGRRTALFLINLEVVVFAVASAFSPSYALLLVFRCGAGFGIGGAAQAVTYYVEFLPSRVRGACLVLIELWWAIGTVFAALLAWAIIPNMEVTLGWRVYLGVCAVPLLLVIFSFIFIPESARYYLTHGKRGKAEKVIKRIALFNCKKPLKGKLVTQEEKDMLEGTSSYKVDKMEEQETSVDLPNGRAQGVDSNEEDPLLARDELMTTDSEASPESPLESEPKPKWYHKEVIVVSLTHQLWEISKLFRDKMWKTTTLLLFIWFGCAWLYYGAVLLTTTILIEDPHCNVTKNDSNTSGCLLDQEDDFYVRLIWTSAAEFPGIFVTLLVIEFIGRKWTMATEFLACGVFYGLLFLCVSDELLTVFLFGIRAFVTGVFQAVYVYTPEVYPTAVRGIGMGINTSIARIGAIITPFVAQVLFKVNDYVTISLYTGSSVLLIILSLLLPIETKGRSLKDSKGT